MKIKKIIIFLAVLFPLAALAEFSASDWKYFKEIRGTEEKLARFPIDDQIFSASQKDLSDLRIVDGSGTEVPYKIVSGRESAKRVSYNLKMLNSSYVREKYSTAVFDMGSSGNIINALRLRTSSENFQRNVKLYGADDMENWNVIKEGVYIYDYTDRRGPMKSQNTTVTFSDSTWRYYKVEISDEGDMPVKIDGASADQTVIQNSKQTQRTLNFSSSADPQKKTTRLMIDLGTDGIPLNKLTIDVKGVNFNRGLAIFASSDNSDWNFLGNDYIFRYSTPKFSGSKTHIDFPETTKRYIKIEVLNYDDAPLEFSALTGFSVFREIVFQARGGSAYRVFYGSDKANRPQYDIEKYFSYLDVDNSSVATLSDQMTNNEFVVEKAPEKPLTERMPFLMPGALSILSIILIFMVYKFLKN